MLTTFSAPHLVIPVHSHVSNTVLLIPDAATNARSQRNTAITVADWETGHRFNLLPCRRLISSLKSPHSCIGPPFPVLPVQTLETVFFSFLTTICRAWSMITKYVHALSRLRNLDNSPCYARRTPLYSSSRLLILLTIHRL